MNEQFDNLDLYITKTSAPNGIKTVAKDAAGNAVATHTSQLYVDRYVLSSLEDRGGKSIRDTAAFIEQFGLELYKAVFGGEILGRLKSLGQANRDVRLKLVFEQNEPELLRIPWEFMYDGEHFLSAYPGLTMSRALEGAPVRDRSAIAGKIRLLAIVSSPLDLAEQDRLQFENEKLLILEALDRAYSDNQIDIEFIDEASLKSIQAKLDEEEFHIVHYTGHGAYSDKEDTGYLLLEDDRGKKHGVDNKTIADLLAGHRSLRLVLLSGCQTAKTSGRMAMSDLATPLLQNGIPAVVAMQYSVTDRSAMDLARKFYTEIANGTPVDLALCRARKELLLDDNLGKVEFGTPVLYATDPDCLAVAAGEHKPAGGGLADGERITIRKNVVLGLEQLGHQFVGRRRELRRIKDDYLRRGIRAVVLHGIGGIGKTVTATKVAERLADHFQGIYAFDCREGLRIEEILIQLNDFLKGMGIDAFDEACTAQIPVQVKVNYLAQVLSQVKLLLIFDNFESLLPEESERREIADPELKKGLKGLVNQCMDGTRFLFTSRYTFNLTDGRLTNVMDEINVGELLRTEAIMVMDRFPDIGPEDFGTKVAIFEKIGGHPYTINIFGSHARHTSAQDVLLDLAGVNRKMVEFTLLDKSYAKLTDRARRLIDGIAVFKKAVAHSALEWVLRENGDTVDVSEEIGELGHWGLIVKLEEEGEALYLVHALVKDFARGRTEDGEWKERLVNGARYYEDLVNSTHSVWDYLDARELYFDAGEYDTAGGIVQAAMDPLFRWGLLDLARKLNEDTIDSASGQTKAAAHHHLGIIHQSQGDYEKAIEKYTESMKIKEALGDKSGIAKTLHQLGNIHYLQGDYEKAIEKYTESMKIKEALGDKSGIAITLHQLGMIHQDQGDYEKAIEKYTESMKIEKELGNKSGIAITLHQLGMIHQSQGDYEKAIEKYTESMKIEKELGNKSGIAITLHQLGMIHQSQGDYEKAIEKYTESMKIKEALGDKSGIAITLGQLGRVHQEKQEYKKALEKYFGAARIFEQLKSPYHELSLKDIGKIREQIGKQLYERYATEIEQESGG